MSSGFGTPWRDDRGLSISFQFAAQGARRADGQDFRGKFRVVSPGFFNTFGVPIQEGRDFNDGDKDGSDRVVIISHGFWLRRFGGDRDIIGKEIGVPIAASLSQRVLLRNSLNTRFYSGRQRVPTTRATQLSVIDESPAAADNFIAAIV